jgi:hypothetical protein
VIEGGDEKERTLPPLLQEPDGMRDGRLGKSVLRDIESDGAVAGRPQEAAQAGRGVTVAPERFRKRGTRRQRLIGLEVAPNP